jgi:uncharacterized protein YcbX
VSTEISAEVTRLAISPIKAMRLLEVEEIELGPHGARGDRRFYIVDERGRMVNAKRVPRLLTILATVSQDGEALSLAFSDGSTIEGPIELGESRKTQFYRRREEVRELGGPFSAAVSDWVCTPLTIVASPRGAADRGAEGAASIVSRASLERFAQAAGHDDVDAKRFRMLIEIDGVEAHGEDRWVGKRVTAGEAVLRVRGHVGRCLVTSLDPISGDTDLPTLQVLRDYRGEEKSTEPLPFGIYGEVLSGGIVRVGDPVTLVGDEGPA